MAWDVAQPNNRPRVAPLDSTGALQQLRNLEKILILKPVDLEKILILKPVRNLEKILVFKAVDLVL